MSSSASSVPASFSSASSSSPTSQVRCRHLLVKHAESRNPVSRRTNLPITKSREEAWKEVHQLHRSLTSANFASFAQKYSDCGSYQRGGDLGVFTRGMMQRSFEDVAFRLEVGELSGIVETDSGFHVILRIE